MADLEAVLADVSYLMAMEKSKTAPAARASKKVALPEPRYCSGPLHPIQCPLVLSLPLRSFPDPSWSSPSPSPPPPPSSLQSPPVSSGPLPPSLVHPPVPFAPLSRAGCRAVCLSAPLPLSSGPLQ